jgi:hypothetical protein
MRPMRTTGIASNILQYCSQETTYLFSLRAISNIVLLRGGNIRIHHDLHKILKLRFW